MTHIATIFDPPDDLAGEPVRMSLAEFKLMEEAINRAQRRHDQLSGTKERARLRHTARRAMLMIWPFLDTRRMILPDAHADISQQFLDVYDVIRRSRGAGWMLPPMPPGLGVIRIQV